MNLLFSSFSMTYGNPAQQIEGVTTLIKKWGSTTSNSCPELLKVDNLDSSVALLSAVSLYLVITISFREKKVYYQ